jgi:integrase/recombinase XerC
MGRWVSDSQAQRAQRVLEGFARWAALRGGAVSLGEVTPEMVETFVRLPVEASAPSVSVMHHRRSVLRLLFRVARESDPMVGDPTLDVVLPPRTGLAARPLADDEVLLCRASARWSLTETRRAAAWALAEATCRSREICAITVRDVDLPMGRVWVHGGRQTARRQAQLSDWGHAQLARRIECLGGELDRPLVYEGKAGSDSGQASTCLAITDVLRRAGLAGEADVRPASIAAWAGRRILFETGRIDVVAQRLGMASLDRAARFIGWEWHQGTVVE